MEKVLILSCSTGQGHNSCAQAIKEYFDTHQVKCDIVDALAFISERTAALMSSWHSRMYRYMPGVFKWGYQYSENHPAVFYETSYVYKFLTSGADRLYKYIEEKQFETIICTHVLSALILTDVLKKYPLTVKTAFVATDYTCSPSMEASDLQHYFIPDASLTNEFVQHGIPKERIIATGIPVRQPFWKQTEKGDAKRLLNINPKRKHLLVMCGSMGCGSIPTLIDRLSVLLTPDIEVSVICGSNKRLYKKLSVKFSSQNNIHITGYSKQVSLYLDSADLFLTKPGGISVTEAASKNLPMCFINAVAGCESYNKRFFIEKGCAVTANSLQQIAEKCIRLLKTDAEYCRMENALKEYFQSNGAEQIFKTLLGNQSMGESENGKL